MLKATCPDCSHELNLDEAKIPAGAFRLKCSKCGKIFTSNREALKAAETQPEESSQPKTVEPPIKQVSSSAELRFQPNVETMVRTEVESAKKEILDSLSALLGGVIFPAQAPEPSTPIDTERVRRVLICDSDKTTVDAIAACWKRLGYSLDICLTAVDAIRKLDMAFYHAVSTELVFPDEPEGGKQILMKINNQKPDQRRKIFVAIISNGVKTTEYDAAFFHGGNITVNKQDLNQLENYIVDGKRFYENLYQNYYEIVSETAERL